MFQANQPHSFLTDYFHTFTILSICCYFTVKAFTVDEIGSIGNLFELVQTASQQNPVSGNQDGSYLTMASKGVIDLFNLCAKRVLIGAREFCLASCIFSQILVSLS